MDPEITLFFVSFARAEILFKPYQALLLEWIWELKRVRVYFAKMNRDEFSAYAVGSINDKLKTVFPQSETIKPRIDA